MSEGAAVTRATRNLGVTAISPERVRANAGLVAQYGGATPPADDRELRSALLETLNRLQPWQIAFVEEPMAPLVTFGAESHFHGDTLAAVMLEEELPEGWMYPEAERQPLRDGVGRGREILAEVAPGTLAGIDFLVGEIVFGRRTLKSGGSLSSIVGVIWLGPKEPWSDQRFAEALAHEYTHHALFLEDMTRGLFSQPVSEMDTDGLVRSAILQRPRGYDKSFHSALVSMVMIELAQELGDASVHARLAPPLHVTVDELDAKAEFLTTNGRGVLGEMRDLLTDLDLRAS